MTTSARVTTGRHPVEGASLYYEVRGQGPTLLMIPGGGGDAGYYTPVADLLADEYAVITYDRRGNSRSTRDDRRDLVVAEQSADARSLIDALGAAPAAVFGNSAGAVIALDLAARFPAGLATVGAHEPPILAVLPDAAEQRAFFDRVSAIYQQQGWYPAWEVFETAIGQEERDPAAGGPVDQATFDRLAGNLDSMLGRELRPTIAFTPDIGRIKESGARVILAGGRKSRDYFYYRTATILAERLGAEFVEFPGHHNAYLDHPAAFAATLRHLLARPDAGAR
ncbi:MAG TPA: alpha/beta hydrolase [Thermomicrobiales bacterium]|nr:alpha/beta hydrolase [Thermomicrobiales bacterium]